MDDLLNQLASVITTWSQLGTIAGLIVAVNLLTNVIKFQKLQDWLCAKLKIGVDTMKKIIPWVAVFLGAAGGFLTALQQGKPVPQAIVMGIIIGLGSIGTHEVVQTVKKSGDTPPSAGKTGANLAIVVTIVGVIFLLPACPVPGPVQPPLNAVIDCLGQNRTQIDAVVNEFKPLISGGQVSWSDVADKGKTLGKEVGTCFVMEMADWFLGSFRSSEQAEIAYTTAEKFRSEVAGGATVQTVCLNADGTKRVCRI